MAKDPICGMMVDESSPLRAERDGQTFYFCSEHCRKKFVGQGQFVESPPARADASSEHSQERRKSGGGSVGHAKHDDSFSNDGNVAVNPSTASKYFCPTCPGFDCL